jgi:hypothetical protein
MAEHKRQHYVPRCYFKPFSKDGEGCAINLFNIASERIVECAPVKGQCARDYMYGEDLLLEKAFQRVEGEYARVVRTVGTKPYSATANDLDVLRFFAAIQYFRTEIAMHRAQKARLGIDDAIFDRESPSQAAQRPSPPDDREIMRRTMEFGIRSSGIFKDLKACIVLNRSNSDFVTSDDPAVFTSRYYFQRLRSRNFGLSSSGAILILPLTPRTLTMFYDGNVYGVLGKIGDCVEITREHDVSAYNELQYLKAARNIYFADYAEAEHVKAEFHHIKLRRPDSWFVISVLVPDESAPPGVERYRHASEHERRTARESLVSVSAIYPEPSRWPSKLVYRSTPRTYNNGSAIGHVRKAEWLTSGGIDRELGRTRVRGPVKLSQ